MFCWILHITSFCLKNQKLLPHQKCKKYSQRWNHKNTLSHIVIDERHCLDNWEFDFRQPSAELSHLFRLKCLLVAMAGTCTKEVDPERNWRQKWRRLLLHKPWSCVSFSCQL